MSLTTTSAPRGALAEVWSRLGATAANRGARSPYIPVVLSIAAAALALIAAVMAEGPLVLIALPGLLASAAAALLLTKPASPAPSMQQRLPGLAGPAHADATHQAACVPPHVSHVTAYPPPADDVNWRFSLERQSQRLVQIADRSLRERAEAQRRWLEHAQELHQFGHEMRTPLNAVIGFSELMKSELLGPLGHPKYRDYVEHVRCSGERLLVVADALIHATGGEPSGSVAPDAVRFSPPPAEAPPAPKPSRKPRAKRKAQPARRKKARKVQSLRPRPPSRQMVMELGLPV